VASSARGAGLLRRKRRHQQRRRRNNAAKSIGGRKRIGARREGGGGCGIILPAPDEKQKKRKARNRTNACRGFYGAPRRRSRRRSWRARYAAEKTAGATGSNHHAIISLALRTSRGVFCVALRRTSRALRKRRRRLISSCRLSARIIFLSSSIFAGVSLRPVAHLRHVL